jgi:hypothetical protein
MKHTLIPTVLKVMIYAQRQFGLVRLGLEPPVTVSRIDEAAAALVGRWPKEHANAPLRVKALAKCRLGMEGAVSATEVRAALVDAARDAGISVQTEDLPRSADKLRPDPWP